jgi:hypothetical protein
MRRIYQEEYLAQFTPQVPSLPPIPITSNHLSNSKQIDTDNIDARDWALRLEEDEEIIQELDDGGEIVTTEDWSLRDVGIEVIDPALRPVIETPTQEVSDSTRLHKINDGSARPKDMSITLVRDAITAGGLTDAALSAIMVEVFSAAHRTGKFISGEEPLLGTMTCRFTGVDLSKHPSPAQAAAPCKFDNQGRAGRQSCVTRRTLRPAGLR